MLLYIIIITLPLVASVLVYVDATDNNIGFTKEKGGTLNMHAGAWGFSIQVLCIIPAFIYIFKRSALIEIAKSNPVKVATSKKLKSIVWLFILWIVMYPYPSLLVHYIKTKI